jgi:replicative DNA helicase
MSQSFIRIKTGAYRSTDVSGRVFQLVEQFKLTAKGGYVTVLNSNAFPGFPDQIRVKVNGIQDYEFVGHDDVPADVAIAQVAHSAPMETDDEVIERIRTRFEILDEMTKAATNGDIRAMIVSGPPGVGKSYGVEQIIEKACLFDQVAGKRLRAEVVKGSATPIGLYSTLYKYSDPNCVLVFDDCDSILLDDVSLNLLKGALDSGKQRKISWLSDSHMLKREGIPASFSFNGSVIFITNIKFDTMRSQKLRDHLDALQSRCHYLDLTLDTMRDKILRIKQIAKDGALFADMDLEPIAQDEIIEFMEVNQNKLREMSLRMAIKVAQLRKSFPATWQRMAQTTCMKA